MDGTFKAMKLINMGKWNDDINKGSKAEDMVLMWLGGKAGFDDILAVEEVKNSWHGQEIFIEEDSVIEKKKPGWIYTSKADRFIFVDCQNEKAAVIQTDELRMGYMNLKDKYKLLTSLP
ncbi:MAG: hypothetical protein M1524_04395 [Patescibacteria group bacterium]|nr:hypothetical protein [Patescibacteria group bacterium]